MISAQLPKNENQRLQALYDYEVLDTEAEDAFDNLTLLASEICGTPIALISLIDPNRQWFKSKVGLDAEETSRDIAFCAHAINQNEIFEIVDTLKDKRFSDNPLVTSSPNIRFYAGSPLITPQGHAIGTLCAISDKPMRLNDHQRKALKVLGHEVISQLELRSQIKQVKLANERKTEFLATLSHELRTPLNAIISFSQLMLNDNEIRLPEKHGKYLEHLNFSGKRLMALVNSILDLNRIEAGKMEIHCSKIECTEFIQTLRTSIAAMAEKKDIKLKFNHDIASGTRFYIDESKLSQVALNIASNAIKFSAKGQHIEVNVFHSGNELTLIFKDNGVGISSQDIPKAFHKFQQVGENRNQEGPGLGLMLSKSLVELMGGQIHLSSSVNNGTLVKITVPTNEPDTTVAELSEVPNLLLNFTQQAKILVVEDNEINCDVALAIFASLGLSIEIAETAEAALAILEQRQFDLIFMDLHLPEMDGYQATKVIKQQTPEQIVIALTADVFAEQDKRMMDSGLCEILNKPVDMQKLIAMLNKYIPKAD